MIKERNMNAKKSSCETCANFIYDDQSDTYFCDINLDEDEMARFLTFNTVNCPYYDFYDEYAIVRKQN
ncbi:MAG: DUF6472 family protein [Clostridia bacterium]|nr:DUF6472 family protein [Clostridia bacterium]